MTGGHAFGEDATTVEYAIELGAGRDHARIPDRGRETRVHGIGGAGQANGQAERRNVGACCEQLFHCLLLWLCTATLRSLAPCACACTSQFPLGATWPARPRFAESSGAASRSDSRRSNPGSVTLDMACESAQAPREAQWLACHTACGCRIPRTS